MEIRNSTNTLAWADFLSARHKREDESVARKFAQFANLGRGHLRNDLCGKLMEREPWKGEN